MKKKVLIVEDELLVAKMYSIILEKNGYDTRVSAVVNDLEVILKEFTPDIIILDNQLKFKQSGFEAAIDLRRNGINLPIIFTTGNSETVAKDFVDQITNSTYKIKPIDGYEILTEINGILK